MAPCRRLVVTHYPTLSSLDGSRTFTYDGNNYRSHSPVPQTEKTILQLSIPMSSAAALFLSQIARAICQCCPHSRRPAPRTTSRADRENRSCLERKVQVPLFWTSTRCLVLLKWLLSPREVIGLISKLKFAAFHLLPYFPRSPKVFEVR